eukprot:CAMPEP_0175950592 /NCGR_PEP_ID=MMETSP0108-20121206/29707_1 /TAXON_ID=195067 ORGANISM="Goniomonas pacifica, Strain CCMP1869" /NCGR_SAMPLE_ID=MMETSP0108 /ASSEMBLY_ACC=CAM_ASM_000204 /LENGTH=52 /DNA_ID=CAMNT_0017276711 /DNA_START=402 /DNA_END=560 /DNA_ORIENTATION=-
MKPAKLPHVVQVGEQGERGRMLIGPHGDNQRNELACGNCHGNVEICTGVIPR